MEQDKDRLTDRDLDRMEIETETIRQRHIERGGEPMIL